MQDIPTIYSTTKKNNDFTHKNLNVYNFNKMISYEIMF